MTSFLHRHHVRSGLRIASAAAVLAAIVLLALAAGPALAGEIIDAPVGDPLRPLGQTDIPTLIGKVIRFILGVTGSIALVMFIYGGFLWMTAAGNTQQVDKGKKALIWSVLGLLAVFGSYSVLNLVYRALPGVSSGGSPTDPSAGEETATYEIFDCVVEDEEAGESVPLEGMCCDSRGCPEAYGTCTGRGASCNPDDGFSAP
jgi:hypothetical protein